MDKRNDYDDGEDEKRSILFCACVFGISLAFGFIAALS